MKGSKMTEPVQTATELPYLGSDELMETMRDGYVAATESLSRVNIAVAANAIMNNTVADEWLDKMYPDLTDEVRYAKPKFYVTYQYWLLCYLNAYFQSTGVEHNALSLTLNTDGSLTVGATLYELHDAEKDGLGKPIVVAELIVSFDNLYDAVVMTFAECLSDEEAVTVAVLWRSIVPMLAVPTVVKYHIHQQAKAYNEDTKGVPYVLVYAQDENGGIGVNNQIPWKLSSDMQFFRHVTSTTNGLNENYSTLVAGRSTWESLPKKKFPYGLPNRQMLVASKTYCERFASDPTLTINDEQYPVTKEKFWGVDCWTLLNEKGEGTIFFPLMEDIKYMLSKSTVHAGNPVYVIGGANVYSQFTEEAFMVVETNVREPAEVADTFFPEYNMEGFTLVGNIPLYEKDQAVADVLIKKREW